METNKVVYGVYKTRGHADRVVTVLKLSGFKLDDISLVLPTEPGSQELMRIIGYKATDSAVVGAGFGAILGGALGFLDSIGSVMIPGFNLFVTSGSLMASLAGVGVGGAIGVIGGVLFGLSTPEYDIRRYAHLMSEGGLLVSVHTEDPYMALKANDLLEATGARNVGMTEELTIEVENTIRHEEKNKPVEEIPPVLWL